MPTVYVYGTTATETATAICHNVSGLYHQIVMLASRNVGLGAHQDRMAHWQVLANIKNFLVHMSLTSSS